MTPRAPHRIGARKLPTSAQTHRRPDLSPGIAWRTLRQGATTGRRFSAQSSSCAAGTTIGTETMPTTRQPGPPLYRLSAGCRHGVLIVAEHVHCRLLPPLRSITRAPVPAAHQFTPHSTSPWRFSYSSSCRHAGSNWPRPGLIGMNWRACRLRALSNSTHEDQAPSAQTAGAPERLAIQRRHRHLLLDVVETDARDVVTVRSR